MNTALLIFNVAFFVLNAVVFYLQRRPLDPTKPRIKWGIQVKYWWARRHKFKPIRHPRVEGVPIRTRAGMPALIIKTLPNSPIYPPQSIFPPGYEPPVMTEEEILALMIEYDLVDRPWVPESAPVAVAVEGGPGGAAPQPLDDGTGETGKGE